MNNVLNTKNLKPTILCVDDTPENLEILGGLLSEHYSVKVAPNGERALRILAAPVKPDLILLDVMMPGISGWDVCKTIKSDPDISHIPVIFLTAKAEMEDEQHGLELGAIDYITKPISPPILLARVAIHIRLKFAADFLRNNNAFLQSEVERRTRQIEAIQDVTILALASLAETRDNETGNHIRRTQHYVKALATALKPHPKFSAYLTEQQIEVLYRSAPLHDIGKVGIPDHILMKPGKLTAEEFEIMKTHTTLGYEAIAAAEQALDMKQSFLSCAMEIALSHQEKWDGSGYPEGLAQDAIPISARLMAIADVYDALISERYYKKAMPHDQAVEIIRAGMGQHFDPDMTECFLNIKDQFKQIAEIYSDD